MTTIQQQHAEHKSEKINSRKEFFKKFCQHFNETMRNK